jgi:hypothetical protein
VDNLTVVVRPGGRFFMLCFSERQPGDTGPRRVTQAEIRASFDRGWQVDSIEPAIIEITIGPDILAWLACRYAGLSALSSRDFSALSLKRSLSERSKRKSSAADLAPELVHLDVGLGRALLGWAR